MIESVDLDDSARIKEQLEQKRHATTGQYLSLPLVGARDRH